MAPNLNGCAPLGESVGNTRDFAIVVASTLRIARKGLGLSIADVAAIMGYSEFAVFDMESGREVPRFADLEAYGTVLTVSAAAILRRAWAVQQTAYDGDIRIEQVAA